MQFIDDDAEVPVPSTPEPEVVPSPPNSGEEVEQSNQGSSSQSDTIPEKPRRVIKKPVRLIEEMEGRNCFVENLTGYALSVADDVESYEPATYKQAISCSESAQWLAAMGEEMQSLYKNRVWELVKVPEGRKLVGCKWIFKKKEGSSESEKVRFTARLVAKGFSQVEGVDFVEIFSPVVRHTSIRVLLSIVAHYDLELEQLDVKTAFHHGDLEEEILMK